ncbi:MAG: glycosyltransferase family 39 protein, partial [Erysipelotrichaceae bacterium]|nr:glycosyltransferase family 39 protein [Erysipelotrichaceae bacterium]
MRDKWINSIAFLLIGFSIVIVALLYLTDRSLWIDEAMLAYSFTERNLTNLVNSPFALNQSAPVLYLYLVKLITMIFKTSAFSLRIFSFSAYLISLYLIYLIAKDLFKLKYPLLVVAFCANMRILIYYANEFKPYMSDVMVVLLVLYLYHRYVIKKLKLYQLIIIYMLFIWLSNPALFFIGGVLAYEFFNSLYHKDHQRSKQVILGGVLVLVSFVSYYFFWLKATANDPYMISFWAYHRFPLLLTDFADLYKLLRLSGALIADMSYNIVLISILIIAGGIISIYQTSRYHIIIYLSIFLALLASYLGKY